MVCCYLAANIIDVIVAFWETIDIKSLYANEGVYTVTTDISSFLTILACSLRPPICVINDKHIRTAVFRQLQDLYGHLWSCCPDISRLRDKFFDTENESEKLVISSPKSPKPSISPVEPSFTPGGGIGALIMARCSINTTQQCGN
ncbi:unnamed protein product [Cylicocyclus nassatus]|uniref:Uncharacterized protein n=1 Tax=Cylicocyclus nassatus TaxID=53992 RepID=A0AA36MCA8_CYLNA|nr:unnamed protein product [Cylicocyclus nassatus]